jgi:hypothetical protein
MDPKYALVTEVNAISDPLNWRASAVAPAPARLPGRHDGHIVVIPRKPGDQRVQSVVVVNSATGVEEPAGIYALT